MDFSSVPKPAWYAAGGIVAVGLGLAIFRKPKTSTPADSGSTAYVPTPASSVSSGPSTSIYSPVTTNTETLTYTYAPVSTDNHSVVTTDNHSVVNGAPTPSSVAAQPYTPPVTAQPYNPPVTAPRPTLAEIQGRISALSSQWWAAQKANDLTGEQKAHDQAAYYRDLAASAGYGTIVTGKDGYPVLQLPNGSTI